MKYSATCQRQSREEIDTAGGYGVVTVGREVSGVIGVVGAWGAGSIRKQLRVLLVGVGIVIFARRQR